MPYSESTYLQAININSYIYMFAVRLYCSYAGSIHSTPYFTMILSICDHVNIQYVTPKSQLRTVHSFLIYETHTFSVLYVMRCLCYVTFNYQICPMCYKQSICMHFTVKYLIFLIICVCFRSRNIFFFR